VKLNFMIWSSSVYVALKWFYFKKAEY
jgi:hypothetical protein